MTLIGSVSWWLWLAVLPDDSDWINLVSPNDLVWQYYLMTWAIYQLRHAMPGTGPGQACTSRDKKGQGMDKQGQARTNRDSPFLSLLVPACPCLSLSVPVCPCLSMSVPVCFYICFTCISPPAGEYPSHYRYEHNYIDFACKRHCSNARKPCFHLLLSSFLVILLPQ